MIPAISLWQPWASLIFTGDKKHETRAYVFPLKYAGERIAIHAAKALPKERDVNLGLSLLCEREFGGNWRSQVPRGAIIGTIRLTNTILITERTCPDIADKLAGDWTPGRFAWAFEEPIKLRDPVPWKGKQGWFFIDEGGLGL